MKKNLSHIIYSRLLEIELKPDVYFAATLDKSNLFFSGFNVNVNFKRLYFIADIKYPYRLGV